MRRNVYVALILALCFVLNFNITPAYAAGDGVLIMGKTVNAVRDSGFSESVPINKNDPHYGWELGQFYFTGFEALEIDEFGKPVFYVNKGDPSFKLNFRLNYDIKKLNDTDKYQINDDTNGYDKEFDIEKTDFGYGALFIRRTDFKTGKKDKTERHLNFLYSRIPNQPFVVTNSMIEGAYEASLDYELLEYYGLVGRNWWNYKISFSFSVRYLSEDNSTEKSETELIEGRSISSVDNHFGAVAGTDNSGHRLIINSDELSKAVHVKSVGEKRGIFSEYYYDPDHDATLLLMTSENKGGYKSPLIGKSQMLTDFIKSIGEKNRNIIPESDDCIAFSFEHEGETVTGKARAYRTEHFISIAVVTVKGETVNRALMDVWLNSLHVFEPEFQPKTSDNPHGVWEIWVGNAISIQRIFAFDDETFLMYRNLSFTGL